MAVDITQWANQPVDPNNEPWYRYGRVVDAVEKHIALRPGAKWLDLGCQWGQFLSVARARFDIQAHGIDDFPKESVIEVCRKFNVGVEDERLIFDGSWSYYDRRIHETGLALAEKFDIISALEIIEHMVDTDVFLDECNKHLVERGHLVITTPNINSLRNRVTVPLGAYPAGLEYRTQIHHVRLYNAPTLTAHAKMHGFSLVNMVGVSFFPLKTLQSSAVRFVDRRLSDALPGLCGNLLAIFRKMT